MCFSAQADLLGGVVVGAIGIDTLRHVHQRPGHVMLAALPLLLAWHQLDEAFVWWGLQGHVSADVGRVATWLYLLFAFVVLPLYVPLAVLALEPSGRRRWSIAVFVATGAAVSIALLAAMVQGPVASELGDHHIVYSAGLDSAVPIVAIYVIATCGALVLSGCRDVAAFGVVNLVAVAVLARVTLDGLASLWCAWAAVTSGAFALHLRFGRPHGSVVLTPPSALS